jgi:hypothetical protein
MTNSTNNPDSAAGVLSDECLERIASACGLYGVRKAAAAYARKVLAAASAQATGQRRQQQRTEIRHD